MFISCPRYRQGHTDNEDSQVTNFQLDPMNESVECLGAENVLIMTMEGSKGAEKLSTNNKIVITGDQIYNISPLF